MNRNILKRPVLGAFSLIAFLHPAPAASATAGGVLCESGAAAVLEGGAVFLGVQIVINVSPGGIYAAEYGTTREGNPVGYFIGVTLLAAYPLAAATGTYLLGEIVDGPAANKGASFGCTTFAAYAQTLVLAFGARMIGMAEGIDSSEALKYAFWADVTTKPLVTTYAYNKIKKPAAGPGESRLPLLEPYVAAAAGSDGAPVPLYGVTFSF